MSSQYYNLNRLNKPCDENPPPERLIKPKRKTVAATLVHCGGAPKCQLLIQANFRMFPAALLSSMLPSQAANLAI